MFSLQAVMPEYIFSPIVSLQLSGKDLKCYIKQIMNVVFLQFELEKLFPYVER